MLKSKFLDIVKTFSPEELRGFRNFVRSPFHNTNKNVIKVNEIVKKYYPDLNNEGLLKEKVFSKIYPGKKYNDIVMRILLSDLMKLAEEFLAYINFNKNPLSEKRFLMNELNERKLNVLFNRHLNSSRDMLGENNVGNNSIDVNYFLNLHQLETLQIDHMISRSKQADTGENVLRQGEYLINFFLINILNISDELVSHEEVLNLKFDFNIVEEFLNNFNIKQFIEYLKENNYKYHPVLSIYYYMYLCNVNPENDNYYFTFKDLIFTNLNLFTKEERFNLFIILESICTSKTLSGKTQFYEQMMLIYETMLSNNLYTHSDTEYFQINLFRNMIYTAVVLKKPDWIEKFIIEYLDKLMPEYRDEVYHFAYTLIYFEKKEFSKALDEISKVRYDFYVFKFDVRLFTLKIYYEMNSFESAISLIDTFTHFLNNNKSDLKNYRNSFFEFLKFLKQLIKIKTGNKKTDKNEIKKEILATERLINKNWLLEKADEL
ncbi:MAG: hypothetical protein ABI840_07985 [bacterium]